MIMPGAIRIELENEQLQMLLVTLNRVVDELAKINVQLTELQSILTEIFSAIDKLEFKVEAH